MRGTRRRHVGRRTVPRRIEGVFGRIGIVNYKPGRGGPGPEPQRRIESAVAEAEARRAGLRVIDRANLPFQYLIVLGR